MIIVYKEPKNGKVELTKAELEDLLEKAYGEGYRAGFDNGRNTVPTTPYCPPTASPSTTPIEPWKVTWTCSCDTNTETGKVVRDYITDSFYEELKNTKREDLLKALKGE